MKKLACQETFSRFFGALSFPIVIFTPRMTVFEANDFFFEKYQVKREDTIGKKCHQVFIKEDRPCPETTCPFGVLMLEKVRLSKVQKTLCGDGSHFYEDIIFSPILDNNGEIEYIVATLKDITRSKIIEADLRKTKDFLEKIIESSGHGIVVADMKGVVLLMNESARRLFGYTTDVPIGKKIRENNYPRSCAREVMKNLRSPEYGGVGRMHSVEMTVFDSSGQKVPVEVTASTIYEGEEEIATMAVFQDLRLRIETEKRLEKARTQLVQADKLSSIGRLAAGVAHEINNPLGGIIMYSHLALEDLPQDSPAQKNLGKIIAQAERCKRIVKGLLDFSRQREPELESVNINDIIEEILALLETQSLFQNISIEKALGYDLPFINGDRCQLQQVFINFAINAAEAMEHGGKLTVKSSFLSDGFVEVRFSDTGCGIRPEDLEKIFEPFFTTKSDKSGTGLGLAVSHGVINKHNGTITVESKENQGTVFIIRLPVKNPPVKA